ncbi:MFS transporter [Rhodoferax ferrireducens]|uniref:MFS transporter n=1 Tax=Rhodoferax ferrireducens TaxID=192843 RepID=UPI003BB7DA41
MQTHHQRLDTRHVSLALCGVAAFLNIYTPQPLLNELANSFGMAPAATTLCISATTLGIAMAAPFAGGLSDRLGRKRVVVLATALLALPTLLCALSTSFQFFVALRFVQGLLVPAIFSAASAYIGDEFSSQELPSKIGIYVAGTTCGALLGRLLPGWCAAEWGWSGAFAASAAVTLLLAFLVHIGLPTEKSVVRAHGRSTGHAVLSLMRDARLVITLLVGSGLLLSQVAIFSGVSLLLAEPPYQFGPRAISSIYAIFLAGVVAAPVCSRFVPWVSHRAVIAVALCCSVFGIALTQLPSLPMLIVGLGFFSTGIFVCQAIANSYLNSIVHQDRALAIGLYLSCYYLGGTVGALVPGMLWESFRWPGISVFALLGTVATALAAWHGWQPVEQQGVHSFHPL